MRKARRVKNRNVRTIINGKKVRKLREKYGLEQKELAELIGFCGQDSISKLETGVTKNITTDKLYNMAYVFECKMSELMIPADVLPRIEELIE